MVLVTALTTGYTMGSHTCLSSLELRTGGKTTCLGCKTSYKNGGETSYKNGGETTHIRVRNNLI